jgi:pantetheine-phosphate adenylyltransferase
LARVSYAKTMKRVGLYPGSFDPLTNGHLAMLRAAFAVFDHVVVAIGINPSKTPLFTAQERASLIVEAAQPLADGAKVTFEVRTFSNLVTQFATEVGATALIRGLRDGTDIDYEMPMAGMNAAMAPGLQTLFFPASTDTRHITATLVRQVAAMGGDVSSFVPANVRKALAAKHQKTQ